jgi:hypothetical protein
MTIPLKVAADSQIQNFTLEGQVYLFTVDCH